MDGTEFIEFVFDGGPAANVLYFISGAGNLDQDGLLGERFLEAWDDNGISLGVVAQNFAGSFDLDTLFGVSLISRFRLTADVDAFLLSSITYTTPEIPLPAAFPLFLAGAGLLGGARRLRRRGAETR